MSILDVFNQFYEDVDDKAQNVPLLGHLWFTPVLFTEETPRIFQVQRADPAEHEVTSFEIVHTNSSHFKNRERLPIKRLNLGLTEEAIISKAKKRPVVLLTKSYADDIETIKDAEHKRLANHLKKNKYIVAPIYSCSKMEKKGTFGPELVQRIGQMRYQHLFLLPEMKQGKGDAIIRLDEAFSTYLGVGSSPIGKKIHSEPLTVLQDQFSSMITGVFSEDLNLAIELSRES